MRSLVLLGSANLVRIIFVIVRVLHRVFSSIILLPILFSILLLGHHLSLNSLKLLRVQLITIIGILIITCLLLLRTSRNLVSILLEQKCD